MAHYAFLDSNNVVTHVIVGKDEHDGDPDWEQVYGALRTSYNTRCGTYYDPQTREPHADQSKAFRKNYAGAGYTYDPVRDAFIPPQPFASWVLNEDTCCWDPPQPYPDDGQPYMWDESSTSWVVV